MIDTPADWRMKDRIDSSSRVIRNKPLNMRKDKDKGDRNINLTVGSPYAGRLTAIEGCALRNGCGFILRIEYTNVLTKNATRPKDTAAFLRRMLAGKARPMSQR